MGVLGVLEMDKGGLAVKKGGHLVVGEAGLGQHLGRGVDDLARPIEGPPQYLLRHTHRQEVAAELSVGPPDVGVGRASKHLDNNAGADHLEDLAGARGPVARGEVHGPSCPKLREGCSRRRWCWEIRFFFASSHCARP